MQSQTNLPTRPLVSNQKPVGCPSSVQTPKDNTRRKSPYLAAQVIGSLLLFACGAEPLARELPSAPDPDPTPISTPQPVVDSYKDGLQTSGAIGFVKTTNKKARLEFSAPIMPRVSVLYEAQDQNYPTTLSGAETVAHNASLTYKFLISNCAASYPDIRVPVSNNEVLSPKQLNLNYNAIAECASAKFTSKPYWIPQLIEDVDICATELGSDWRLPTEADIADLQDADFDFINRTLTLVTTDAGMLPGADLFGTYYFSLTCYIRGTDGSLRLGNLSSGVTNRVTALPVPPSQYKTALQSLGMALRCVRQTQLP